MPRYVALFSYTLKLPIRTTEQALPPLRVSAKSGYLVEVLIQPVVGEGLIRRLDAEATYDGADLEHICWALHGPEDGIQVRAISAGMRFYLPPWEVASDVVTPLLYNLSGLTLQSHIYTRLEEELSTCVTDFKWRMPDGKTVPPIEPGYPAYMLHSLTANGERPLLSSDWSLLQEVSAAHA